MALQLPTTRIFRGLEDVNFRLFPVAERADAFHEPGSYRDEDLFQRLSWFYIYANDQGLPLPSFSSELHDALMRPRNSTPKPRYGSAVIETWLRELQELMAIAQHYGVKTPLLDWTRSPLVAMNFAVHNVINRMVAFLKNPDQMDQQEYGRQEISVWAFDYEACMKIRRDAFSVRNAATDRDQELFDIGVFTPPTQNNPNIVAQKGCFTWHKSVTHRPPLRYDDDYMNNPSESDLLVAAMCNCKYLEKNSAKVHPSSDDMFIRHTLKYSKVPDLYALLQYCEVPPSSLFPGFDGCAQEVKRLEDYNFLRGVAWE